MILVSLVAPKNWPAGRGPPPLCGRMANLHALSDRGSIQPSLVGALQDAAVFRAPPSAIETFMDLITVALMFVFNVGQLAEVLSWLICRAFRPSCRAGSSTAPAPVLRRLR